MMKPNLPVLPALLVEDQVRHALLEDLGRAGDITTQAVIGRDRTAAARLNARQTGILAGMAFARAAFRLIDPSIRFDALSEDGGSLSPGQDVAVISGPAQGVLSAERVALNYLMHLSGVATYTDRFAREIAHTAARITCTRKTMPGLRAAEKYAVRIGGGSSHRYGLDDAILIKDNHVAVAGGVRQAIRAARAFAGHLVRVEVEVDSLQQCEEALAEGPDVILLDNMAPAHLSVAVAMNRKHSGLSIDDYPLNRRRIQLEASGNVAIDTVRDIAETGVDYISTSKITMAAPTLDLGLDIAIG